MTCNSDTYDPLTGNCETELSVADGEVTLNHVLQVAKWTSFGHSGKPNRVMSPTNIGDSTFL